MKTESKIQQSIFLWYHNQYCLKGDKRHIIFSVPNESKSKSETLQKKRMGLISGVSDMIVVRDNEVLFIEVKTSKGVQSERQKVFQKSVENLGFKYYLVRSLEDFKKIIQ